MWRATLIGGAHFRDEVWSGKTLCEYMSSGMSTVGCKCFRCAGSVVPAKSSASRILETPFQSTFKCVARISKKLYAECRVVKRHEYVPRGF